MITYAVSQAGFSPKDFLVDRQAPPSLCTHSSAFAAVYVDNAAMVGCDESHVTQRAYEVHSSTVQLNMATKGVDEGGGESGVHQLLAD